MLHVLIYNRIKKALLNFQSIAENKFNAYLNNYYYSLDNALSSIKFIYAERKKKSP